MHNKLNCVDYMLINIVYHYRRTACNFHLFSAEYLVGCTDPLSQLLFRVQKDEEEDEDEEEEEEEEEEGEGTDGRGRADDDGQRRKGQNGSRARNE